MSANHADHEAVSRRRVISAAGVGWLALGGSAALTGLAAQRFCFPNVVDEPDPTLGIGKLSDYVVLPVGGVSEAFRQEHVWVVRLADRIVAMSTRCTHLGCLTHWVERESQFQCPCHGSAFGADGLNLAGPAPRALDRLKIWRAGDDVFVDRSRAFRHERREWNDPDSFLAV